MVEIDLKRLGFVPKLQPLIYSKDNLRSAVIFIVSIVLVGIICLFSSCQMTPARAETTIPDNLYMGIIAEDTSGNYQTYLAIASVVRNRLNAGMNNGLIALKRKHLEHFVQREVIWAAWHDIDLVGTTESAIQEVFEQGKDYVNGATNYEHTGVYPIPKYTKKMRLVKVMYPHTKDEISFWKSQKERS